MSNANSSYRSNASHKIVQKSFFRPFRPYFFLSYQWWAAPSWWMPHVAVMGLSMVDLVSMVVVAMMCVGLVALRTGPVPLTQGWRHSLLAWDIVSLHEGHARQHRLTAQQPSLVIQTKCQSKSRTVKKLEYLTFQWHLTTNSCVNHFYNVDFKHNKNTTSKCFYKHKPFQIIAISVVWTKNQNDHLCHDCTHKQWWDGEGVVNREQRNWLFLEMRSDSHWPISYGLEQSCWNGVSSSLFEYVCVWGKREGGLHSGLGVTDEITPTQIIRGQGLKVEAWQSIKLTFLGVGMSNLFRFGKSPNFHIYDHKWSSDIRLSGTEAPMVWCMTCFCEWEKPAG